jgi:Chaperone of endosialidase
MLMTGLIETFNDMKIHGNLTASEVTGTNIFASVSLKSSSVIGTESVSAAKIIATSTISAPSMTVINDISANKLYGTSIVALTDIIAPSIIATSTISAPSIVATTGITAPLMRVIDISASVINVGRISATGPTTTDSLIVDKTIQGNLVIVREIDAPTIRTFFLDASSIQTNRLDAVQDVSTNTIFARTSISTATVYTTSDYRIKSDISELDDFFTVDSLRPVSYENQLTNSRDIGLIAHEVQEHYPYLVSGKKDGNERQSVNYTGLIGILIHEIKCLKRKVHDIEELILKSSN